MMQSAFNYIAQRIKILRINLINTYREETAYFSKNWASFISPTVYAVTYILFINILYRNIPDLAGYSKNEMLFFTLMGEISFYLTFNLGYENLELLIKDVNKGNLDLILTRPLPHLFYISFRRINFLEIFKDSFIPITILVIIINWHILDIHCLNLIVGILTLFIGVFLMHVVQLFLALPVFWKGEAQTLFSLSYILGDSGIPYEGFFKGLRYGFTVVLPILVSAALSASVILGKSNAFYVLTMMVFVLPVFIYLRIWGWKKALKNYSSASS